MKQIHRLLRLFIFMGMVFVMAFSFPVSSHTEYTSESIPEEITSESNVPTAAVRKPSPLLLKLKMITRLLPILFLVSLIALLCLPNRHTPFKSSIRVLLRKLFLDPIRFTSTFVS
ncbi:hypothetical protein J2T13_003477 [Paenibacillus sp. DS2015]|uniref:hypothetical protein n=1 Tax=Paenibacillus sp. DS2015 TaxID=3373917 RepID=UPI003D215ED9